MVAHLGANGVLMVLDIWSSAELQPSLGVCYYPEHWPASLWPEDAARMSDIGVRWVWLCSWEAVAHNTHNTKVVSYFRWRQAPFAQEKMHAGLMLCANTLAPGTGEAQQFAEEIAPLSLLPTK